LDSAAGERYKGTSADKFSVASSADVADFWKQIHQDNASIFTAFTSSQLFVYKNKAVLAVK
jgi:hypothetical protein